MDSATSGSLQSSSGGGGGGGGGGDDELDSRPDALSAFFHGPALSHPFDSLSHYLSPPSPLLPFSASSAPAPPANPNPSRHFLSSSSHGPAAPPASSAAASGASAPAGPGQQRSSRKRTRASRRAPTTVLNTDTTNFRAMVQEFTGIPSPPFAAAATTLQYRSSARFGGHLFSGGGASSSSAAAVADQPQQPPYLLRPFAQKLQPFPPLPSPSNTHSPAAAAAAAATTASTAINTSPITATLTACTSSGGSSNLTTPTSNTNYQLPPPQHSLLNTQHPILSFQSLLQSQPPSNYAMPSMLTFSTRPPHFTVSSTQYGSGDVGLPPGLIGSEDLSGWAAGGNPASQSRPAGPNYAAGSAPQQRGSSCKVNYSSAAGSSAPDQFNAEKGPSSAPENAAAAAATTTTIGEGTVDSWISSSRRHDH